MHYVIKNKLKLSSIQATAVFRSYFPLQYIMILPNAHRDKSSLWENSQTFPDAKAAFGRTPTHSPSKKQPLGGLPRTPRAKSDLWEDSHALPNEKAAFGRTPTPSPARTAALRSEIRTLFFCVWEAVFVMKRVSFASGRAFLRRVALLCKKTAGEARCFILLSRRECGRGRLHCVCGCKGATACRI